MAGKSEGISILDGMVAETLGAVAEGKAKATLTALPGEDPLPMGSALIPNDTGIFMSNEALFNHAKGLRKFAADAIAIADGIDAILNERSDGTSATEDPKVAQKQKEDAAEERINSKRDKVAAAQADVYSPERFSALSEAAQAATFGTPAADPVGTHSPGGWQCPDHPAQPTEDATSPKGRQFKRCTADECKQFER